MPKQCPFDASVNMWYTPKMCGDGNNKYTRWWAGQMADNETNETEIMVVMPIAKTPPPTSPVVEFSMVATITSAAAAVVNKSALLAAVKATLGSDNVDDSDIIVEQEFQVVQTLTIPGADAGNMKEDVLKATVGGIFSVSAHKVDIELSIARRLREGRRLGTATVKATINTDDAAAADTIKQSAADTSSVASAFKSSYETEFFNTYQATVTVEVPAVAAPTLEMEIVYSVRSAPNKVIAAPDTSTASTFATKLAENTDSLPTMQFVVVTPTPTSAPTPMPTKVPTDMPTPLPAGQTHMPTAIPTASPTKMPTKMPTAYPTKDPTRAPTAAAPTAGAPTAGAPTAMGTTTAAPTATKATESAAFNTKVSGCVAIALTTAMALSARV